MQPTTPEVRGRETSPVIEVLNHAPSALILYKAQLRNDVESVKRDEPEQLAEAKIKEMQRVMRELEIMERMVAEAKQGKFVVMVNDSRQEFNARRTVLSHRVKLGDPNTEISKDASEPTHQLCFFLQAGGGESRVEQIHGAGLTSGINRRTTANLQQVVEGLEERPTPDTTIILNTVGLYREGGVVRIFPNSGVSFQHRTGERGATVHGVTYVGDTPHFSSLERAITMQHFNAKEHAFPRLPRPSLRPKR